MSAIESDYDFVPADDRVIEKHIGRTDVPVRLRFEPFGRPEVGKPGKGDNRILYVDAYLSTELLADDRQTIRFEVNDTKYILAPGRHFRADVDSELADQFPEIASLADCGRVLGREDESGGFRPVGVGVEVAIPERVISRDG